MKIIVKESNHEKIEKILNEAQGKARTRLVDYSDIERTIKRETNLLMNKYIVPKKALKGLRVRYMPDADSFPKAYKYTPEATYFIVEYGSNGKAALVGCGRDSADRAKEYRKVISVPEKLKIAIIESYENGRTF